MKQFISLVTLLVFFVSSMPATFAESVEGINSLIDNLPEEGIFLSQASSDTNLDREEVRAEMADLDYEIAGPYMDKYEHGNGEVSAKIYSAPRELSFNLETREYSQLPDDFSYFDYYNEGRRVPENGYQYFIGNGRDIRENEFKITSGVMSFGETEQGSLVAESFQVEGGVKYNEVYPGVDVEFKDDGFSREKFITIKEEPEYLSRQDDLIFSDVIEAPEGARLMIADAENGKEIEVSGEYDLGFQPFYIVLEDGTIFEHGNSIAYDSLTDPNLVEAGAVGIEQKIIFDEAYPEEYVVQQVVPGEYLRSEERQYPVVIDPRVHYCKEGLIHYLDENKVTSGCSMQDFYSREPEGNYYDNPELFMGKGGSAYRLPVVKFDNLNNFIPQGSTIDDAWLNAFYKVNGVGTYSQNSDIFYQARMIDASWGSRGLDYLLSNTSRTGSTTGISYNPGKEYTWYIKDMVQDWVSNSSTNNGLLLAQTGSRFNWQDRLHVLHSSTSSDQAKRPFLSVRYTEPPASNPDLEVVLLEQVTPKMTYGDPFQVRVGVKRTGSINSNYNVRVNLGDGINDNGPPADEQTVLATDPTTKYMLFTVTPHPLFYPLNDIRVELDVDDDIQESDETNNIEITPITSPPTDPDLIVDYMYMDEYSLHPGDSTRVYAEIKNEGETRSNSSSVDYYVSDTNSMNGAIYLNSDNFGELDYEETVFESGRITLPSYLSAGTYYIIAKVDPDDVVSEGNENNNLRSVQIEVFPADPQVRIDSVVAINNLSEPVEEGDILDVAIYRAQNVSQTTDAPAVTYNLILVEQSTGNEFALLNQQPATFNMPSDSTQTLNASGEVPFINSGGQYRLRVILDHANNYREVNEVDNTKESAQFEVKTSVQSGPSSWTYNGSYSSSPYDSSNGSSSNVNTENDSTNSGGDPVNLRTGHFDLTHSDFLIDGVGQPMLFKRTYNSKLNDIDARFGAGWSFSYNVYYYQDPTTKNIRVYHGGNLANTFETSDGGLTFEAPEGSQDTLMLENGQIVYKTLNGMKFVFGETIESGMAVLTEIIDTNGNTTTLEYFERRDIKLLERITDQAGRELLITYGDESDDRLWDNIVKVETVFGGTEKVENVYTYDLAADPLRVFLTSATQSRTTNGVTENVVRSFTYDAEGRMESYTDPRGTRVRNVYDDQARVIEQYMHNPRVHSGSEDELVYTYGYDHMESGNDIQKCTDYREIQNATEYSGAIMCFNSEELKVLEKDHLGNETQYEYNQDGLPIKVVDAKGNETTMEYDALRRLVKKTWPDNGFRTEVAYEYEDTFNKVVKKEETATDLSSGEVSVRSELYSYDAFGNMVSSIDYRGEETKYTYDSKGNVLTSEDPRGNVYSYVYDADGNYLVSESIEVTDVYGVTSTNIISYTYDVFGNKTSRTDGEGNTWNYEYDNLGNLLKQINPDATTVLYEYDLENNLVEKIDENGQVTEFEIDGNLEESKLSVTRKSANGDLVAIQNYTQLGRKTSVVDPNGNVMSYQYDAGNRLVGEVTPIDSVDKVYDANGLLVESTNALGQRITYEYDSRNQLIKSQAYDGSEVLETVTEYDGFGRVVSVTDPNGNVVKRYEYFLNSDLVYKELDVYGNAVTYDYDANGNKIKITDKKGNETLTEYDELNRLIKVTYPDGKISTKKYDKRGLVVEAVDRMNADGSSNYHKTEFEYDDRGRLLKTIYADGSEVRQTYDGKGNVLKQIDALGRETEYEYDDFDRVVKVIDNAGEETISNYDANGNLTSVTNANGHQTSYEYDAGNRLVKTIVADGSEKTVVYDSSSNVLESADFNGNITRMEYDELNRVVKEVAASNDETIYTYDKNGNMLSEKRGDILTSFVYDERNRLIEQYDPHYSSAGRTTPIEYEYDANDNMVLSRNHRSQVITYSYDELDRMVEKVKPEGTISYEYDNWNNLIVMDDEAGLVNYTYDELNRNLTESRTFNRLSNVYTVQRSYLLDGSLDKLIDPFNNEIDYDYDNRGMVDSVDLNGFEVANYSYDGFGNVESATTGNGVTTTYSYDDRERMTGLDTTMFNAPAPILEHDYAYDHDGNRESLIENGVTTTYEYDVQNQLTEVLSGQDKITYNYREFGWLDGMEFYEGTTKVGYRDYNNWTISNQHAFTADFYGVNNSEKVAVYRHYYDLDGNLSYEYVKNGTPAQVGPHNFQKNYLWDSENRMIEHNVHTYGDESDKTIIGEYEYDDFGNRTYKKSKDEETYYMNNGLNVLNEITSTGTMSKLMVAGVGELSFDGTFKYIHTDVQGTARLVTNELGEVVAEYKYEPFGELAGVNEQVQGGEIAPLNHKDMSVADGEMHLGYDTEETDYLYTGQEFDDESGLMYYNARYYNPVVGRFVSRDTYMGEVGDTLSRSRYAYVKNNPYRYVDPTGNYVETVWDVFWVAVDVGQVAYGAGKGAYGITKAGIGKVTKKDHWVESGLDTAKSGGGHIVEGGSNLAIDIVATGLPAVPAGVGRLDDLYDVGKSVNKSVDIAKNVEKTTDAKKATQIAENRAKGLKGEIEAGINPNVKKKPIEVDNRTRIPDYINIDEKILLEIKNVNYLSNSSQLRDFARYSQEHNLDFVIEVANRTKLSKTLLRLEDEGVLTIKRIGDTLNNKKATTNILSGTLILNIGLDGASYLDNK